MFTNVGWVELLVLGVVALVVIGPERLPQALRWVSGAIKDVKRFAASAQQQISEDFGADLDTIKEPLQQINELRSMNPRSVVTKHLLDGDDSLLTGSFDAPHTTARPPATAPSTPAASSTPAESSHTPHSSTSAPQPPTSPGVWSQDSDAT